MIINSKENLEAVGKSVFTYRSDMFLFSSHRQAWLFMVCELLGKSEHQMEQSLW